jgi:hypothetical protein
MSVLEPAQLLNVCPQTIHEWKRRRLLKFHKLFGRTYSKRTYLLETCRLCFVLPTLLIPQTNVTAFRWPACAQGGLLRPGYYNTTLT